MYVAVASGGVDRRRPWVRILRLAAAGLLVGAVVGFAGALLRPRPWVEYVEPRTASGS